MKHPSTSYLKEKWSHSGFQKYFKNTSWMFGARILSMGISFIATIYIARNLGPTNFGQLSYSVSLVGLFGFIASLGIDGILYRDLIKHREKRQTLLGTAFYIKLCAGVLAASASVLFSIFVVGDDVSKILIFILSGTFILNAFQIILFDFQSRAESKYPSIVAVSIALILNILKIITIATGRGVIYLAFILLMESLLYAIFYIFIYETRTADTITSWKFDKWYAVSLLKDSSPLIAFSAFSLIYARIDQVLIKHMMDASAVGLYDSAVRISEAWSFIPGIIVSALYPAIVNAKKTSDDIYNKRLGRLAMFLLILAVVIAVPVTLLAPYIMNTLYGSAFMGGVIVLRIYIWAGIGTSLGILIFQYLVTENSRKIILSVAFVPMACSVVLNILWIPVYGIAGAAYATLISYSLTPLSLLLFKETRSRMVSIYRSFL
ncbi:MAG: flippase [bacterium]